MSTGAQGHVALVHLRKTPAQSIAAVGIWKLACVVVRIFGVLRTTGCELMLSLICLKLLMWVGFTDLGDEKRLQHTNGELSLWFCEAKIDLKMHHLTIDFMYRDTRIFFHL